VDLSYLPDPDAHPSTLLYTFGGGQPVQQVRPGTTVRTWTRNCFAGAVSSTRDLVSQVCDPRYLNPQTGPFFVKGAEPGAGVRRGQRGQRGQRAPSVSAVLSRRVPLVAAPALRSRRSASRTRCSSRRTRPTAGS
jgi:hypothetical protein